MHVAAATDLDANVSICDDIVYNLLIQSDKHPTLSDSKGLLQLHT